MDIYPRPEAEGVVRVVEASVRDRDLVDQMSQDYLDELSHFDSSIVRGSAGRFEYPYLDLYWSEVGRTPLLVQVQESPVGFVLVRELASNLREIAEFFVHPSHRRRGIGRKAAFAAFDSFPGRWEVQWHKSNDPARGFWLAVIRDHSEGDFSLVGGPESPRVNIEFDARPRNISDLRSGPVSLRYERTVPGDSSKGLVPAFRFDVLDEDGAAVGHVSLNVGSTRHVVLTAGHVGYEILPERRGSSYSYHACLALAPLVWRYCNPAILTVDPDNAASIRVIEKLGAKFLEEAEVPVDDPAYEGGARRRRRYMWEP